MPAAKFYLQLSITSFCVLCLVQFLYAQQPQKMNKFLYYSIRDAESPMPETTRTWVCDSAIIFELNCSYNFITAPYKYIYLDLHTFKYQDYLSFSDTAAVMANYKLKPQGQSYPGFQFIKDSAINKYATNKFKVSIDSTARLTDTFMNKVNYHRLLYKARYQYGQQSYLDGRIYYFLYNKSINSIALNMDRAASLCPGCFMARVDLFTDDTSIKPYVFENKIYRKLANDEEKVFKQWSQNAKKTKLPLLNHEDSLIQSSTMRGPINKNLIIPLKDYDFTAYLKQKKYRQLPTKKLLPANNSKIGINEVIKWLITQQQFFINTDSNKTIAKVLANLESEKLYREPYEGGNIIVVPIDKQVQISKNVRTDLNAPLQYLILKEDSSGDIKNGYMILFYPLDSSINKLPANAFADLFTNQILDGGGTISLIIFPDELIYETDFAVIGEMEENRVWRTEPPIFNNSNDTFQCRDYLLDKMVIYTDGSYKFSSQFLYTKCLGTKTGNP